MPTLDTQRVTLRLREMAVKLATSFPEMKWKDIHAVLEKQKRDGEYLGKPETTQKHVAVARRGEPSPEESPWQIDMVGDGYPVSPEALAAVMSAYRWHMVGQGVPFTVRMAKWVSRLRLLAGTDGLKNDLDYELSNSAHEASEGEILDGLLTQQSLGVAREAVGFAAEELACVALDRKFDPTGRMIELAWEWLDQSRDFMKKHLRIKAKQQVRALINRAGDFELSDYQVATHAQAYGWHSDDYSWATEVSLDPLDKLAAEVLGLVISVGGYAPRREVTELVIGAARNKYPGVDSWAKQTEPEKHAFVKSKLFQIKTGGIIDND